MKNTTILVLCLGAVLCVPGQNAQAQTPVETGRQLYRANCQPCHGAEGDNVPGVDFKSGEFRRASSDDDLVKLILSGIPGTAMPPTNLAEPSRRALVAYLRSLHAATMGTSASGDAANGKALFEGKGGCLRCHRVGDQGSRVGPDLGDVGSRRPAAALQESIIAPSETILPQNRFVHIVLKDGTVVGGRRLNEDTYTVEVIDQKEQMISVSRDNIREYTLLKTSPMPSYQGKLSSREVSDLVAYLLSLKGVQ